LEAVTVNDIVATEVAVSHSVAPFGRDASTWLVKPGATIASTLPPGRKGLQICRLNGGPGFVSNAHWNHELQGGDVLEWLEYPRGGDDFGGVLQFAITFAAGVISDNPYLIALAFAQFAVNVYNLPVGIGNRPDELQQSSPTYTTGISGNQARLYSVIPKGCGRMQTYPPFAAQAYSEFNETNDQYLFVLLALGIGNYQVERTLIDDTDISHFADVLTLTYLPPGTPPAVVKTNVINSAEVAGQEMLTGQIIGGFAACAPRTVAQAVAVDVTGPRGIGFQSDSGELDPLEVKWQVQIRSLNEFGTPLTPWTLLANETRTVADREVQRWSVKYEIDPPIRPEIRVVRTDVKSTNVRFLNELVWAGMRAYLDGVADLNPNVTHIEVVMRSSKQLNGISQNRISVISTAMVPEVLADGTRGAEIPSRNAADSLADLWLSTTWGEGLDISQVDMATLYKYRQIWEARQDRFDYNFDTAIDADAAAQIIAESGRARAFRRGGVRTLARDELVTLPRTAFTTRNTVPGSMATNEDLPKIGTPDGVIVEYWDNRAWNYGQPIECPCPGVVDMLNPVRLRKAGVTGKTHAKREGLYEAAKLAYRRRTVSCTTEMQGRIPAYGSAVRWQSEVMRTQSGDVVSWDAIGLAMGLTESPQFGSIPLQIVLLRDDGSVTTPVTVSQGTSANEVILSSAPDFTPITDEGMRERTQYIMGAVGVDDFIVKIAGISDGGNQDGVQLYDIAGFIDDPRVHAADNPYLPNPGETQDPIDTSPGEPGGGTQPVPNLNTQFFLGINNTNTTPVEAKYTLKNTGEAVGSQIGDTLPQTFSLAPNWLFEQPVGTDITSQFEVRFTYLSGFGPVADGTFDTWMTLDVDRFVRLYADEPTIAPDAEIFFRVEIRDIATLTLQAQTTIHLQVNYVPD
jgi:hypothetical protein